MAPVPPMVSVPVAASKFHVTSPVAASERLSLMVLPVPLFRFTAASPALLAANSTLSVTVLLASFVEAITTA